MESVTRTMKGRVTCTAPVNIAVIKYWGKRETKLNLPTNSSLSVTLSQDDLHSKTTAAVVEGDKDHMWLNGQEEAIKEGSRLAQCLEALKGARAQIEKENPSLEKTSHLALHIASENNFPTAAGLASSASGLCALVAAVSEVFELEKYGFDRQKLSIIARQGSGSACRSVYGGFVAWNMGEKADGSDSVAREVAPVSHWPDLNALILVVSDAKKGTGSTVGMQRTVATSELLKHRVDHCVPGRMAAIEKAILDKDFDAFAEITMKDSNQFHAVCLDTDPPIFYLNDVSKAIIALVNEYNRAAKEHTGRLHAAYTFDAGPNAVIYAQEKDTHAILGTLLEYFPVQGVHLVDKPHPFEFNRSIIPAFPNNAVQRIIHTRIGDGPRVLAEGESLLDASGLPTKKNE